MKLSKGKLSNKSRNHSQIEVVTDWQHTQEVTPAMRLLLMLLLRPRGKNEVKLGGSR